MTPQESSVFVAWLASKYPTHKLSPESAKAYAEEFLELTKDEANFGAKRIVRTCKFFPSIAEVFELCKPKPMTGLEAWGEIEMAVRKFGRYETPEFEDPILQEAVKRFGWKSLCDSTNEEVDRAHFSKLYDACRQRLVPAGLPALPAIPKDSAVANLVAGIGNGGGQ